MRILKHLGFRRTSALAIVFLTILAAPFVGAYVEVELQVIHRLERIKEAIPEKTTPLLTWSSVETRDATCWSTTAHQLATSRSALAVAESFKRSLGSNAHYSAAWFQNRKAVRVDLEGELTQPRVIDVDELPSAAKFLMNIHAFLPDGARRVVVFSEEKNEHRLDPRCW